LVQIRLNERGCVQYDDLAGPSPIRDFFRAHGWLMMLAAMVPVYYSGRRQWIDPITFYIWLPLMAVSSFALWKATREFRGSMKEVREGAVADWNAIYRKPLAWEKVKSHSLEPAKSGMYRLTITRHGTFSYEDVDTELSLNAEQANALEELLANWTRAAQPH